jgi:hypothetical protein
MEQRKAFFIIVLLLATFSFNAVRAQDTLKLGEVVAGKLDNANYEVQYTFAGKQGDWVLVSMFPKPGTYDLSPTLILRDSTRSPMAQNDGFTASGALVMAKLPADGDYNILATRQGGSTGSSQGEFILRATVVTPLAAGDTVEATIYSKTEKNVPEQFLISPQKSGSIKIGFSQEVGDLFPLIELREWTPDNSGEFLFDIDAPAKISEGALKVDMQEGKLYILTVRKSDWIDLQDDVEAKIRFSFN